MGLKGGQPSLVLNRQFWFPKHHFGAKETITHIEPTPVFQTLLQRDVVTLHLNIMQDASEDEDWEPEPGPPPPPDRALTDRPGSNPSQGRGMRLAKITLSIFLPLAVIGAAIAAGVLGKK